MGWVEIPQPHIRKGLPDGVDPRHHSDGLAAKTRQTERLDIPGRVDIQVAGMDHVDVGFAQQFYQGTEFAWVIGEPGEHEVVEGNPDLVPPGDPDRFNDIIEGILLGLVIGVVELGLRGVKANPHAIQPGLAKPFHGGRQAGIGVDVDVDQAPAGTSWGCVFTFVPTKKVTYA